MASYVSEEGEGFWTSLTYTVREEKLFEPVLPSVAGHIGQRSLVTIVDASESRYACCSDGVAVFCFILPVGLSVPNGLHSCIPHMSYPL